LEDTNITQPLYVSSWRFDEILLLWVTELSGLVTD